jgi:arylsulfatase A-like enzyme
MVLLWWWVTRGADISRMLRRCMIALLVGAVAAGLLQTRITVRNSVDTEALRFPPSAEYKPHVFVVLIDALRADHLPFYGYPMQTAPVLESVARDGVVYTRAFAQSSWTRPSCGSLFTSYYPSELSLGGMNDFLPHNIPILPQFLQNEGYRTAGISSSVHINSQFGFDKGFDILDIGTTYLRWTGASRPLGLLGLVEIRDYYPRYNAEKLTDRALGWIRKQQKTDAAQPLFMYLHYTDPHAPYRPPEAEDRWRDFAGPAGKTVSVPPFSPTWKGSPLSEGERDALVARYDAEIAYFDKHFDRFVNYLKEAGIYDDTLLIITADHGEEFNDHGGWEHSRTLYNELIRVPLIVKYPSRFKELNGRRNDAVAALIDVLPTVQTVLGAEWSSSDFRGASLTGLSNNPGSEHRMLFASTKKMRAVLDGPDKFIQSFNEDGSVAGEEYFSLVDDFLEQGGGSTSTLTESRLEELRSSFDRLSRKSQDAREITIDEETLRELRALGYVE